MSITEGAVSLIREYFSAEFVVLIPFLMLIGLKLKKSKRIADNLIPRILSYIGVAGCLIISLSQNEPQNVYQWITLCIVGTGQGFLAGLCAVGLHQLFKQRDVLELLSSFEGGTGNDVTSTDIIPDQNPVEEYGDVIHPISPEVSIDTVTTPIEGEPLLSKITVMIKRGDEIIVDQEV